MTKTTRYPKVISATAIRKLTTAQLESMRAEIEREIERRRLESLSEQTAGGAQSAKPKRPYKPRDHGPVVVETKTINGRAYLYERWWENGVRKSKYLGKAEGE